MPTVSARHLVLQTVIVALLVTPAVHSHAAVISTEQAMQAAAGAEAVARVQAVLARDDARAALTAMGVDPDAALLRVATLTPAEALALAERLERLPAGGTGVIEVVGIVAVVLLLLEVLGVTNVFTKI